MNVVDWSSRFNFGSPRSTNEISGICIHVTVNAPGTPAENVANYQISSQSGSYHELTDTRGIHLIENTDDWLVWAAGPTSNRKHLHRSFVMRGTESRAEWLQHEDMLRQAAARDARWAMKYNIPVVKLSGADLRAGKRGFFGHVDTAHAWGETDHVDPGAGFPWDVYLQYVREAMGPREEKSEVLTPNYFTDFVKGFFGPLISDVKDVRQQITGGRDAGQYSGWSVSRLVQNASSKPGDYATLPEMLALVLTKLNDLEREIANMKDGRNG